MTHFIEYLAIFLTLYPNLIELKHILTNLKSPLTIIPISIIVIILIQLLTVIILSFDC